jgi:3-isopropylmalate dehydratase small subunit
MKIVGKAWKLGDNVDTDAVIPARYLSTSDPEELAKHFMEDINPGFVTRAASGDIIVAGKNFGCGSSREHVPIVIKHAKIGAVIAASFARIFYRNAFNMGLPILESVDAAAAIETGDELEVDLLKGTILNLSKRESYRAEPIPDFMRKLLKAGGLIPYVRQKIKQEADNV